jgi:hypothetical protein
MRDRSTGVYVNGSRLASARLKKAGVWPDRPKVEEYEGNVASLQRDLESIVVAGGHSAHFYDCIGIDETWFPLMLRAAG